MIRNVYWKFEQHPFVLVKIFSSSSNIFSFILLFLFEKYGLHAFQNGLELPSKLSFSKYCRFTTRFRGHVNLTMSLGLFDLFNLIWRSDLIIICSRRFLLKWVFWFSQIFLFSWEHVYVKLKQNYFQRLHGFS